MLTGAVLLLLPYSTVPPLQISSSPARSLLPLLLSPALSVTAAFFKHQQSHLIIGLLVHPDRDHEYFPWPLTRDRASRERSVVPSTHSIPVRSVSLPSPLASLAYPAAARLPIGLIYSGWLLASSFAFDDMVSFSNKPTRGLSFSRPATADPLTSGQKRQRGNILGVASDALRFGRRRRSIKTPPPPPQPRLLLQEVIEVRGSAPTPTFDEDEEAEREQLRAAAVQSVGFDVDISRPPDREHTAFGDEGDMNERTDHVIHTNGHHQNRRSSPLHSLPSIVDNTINIISDAPGSPYTVRQRVRVSSHDSVRAAQTASTVTSTSPSTEIPAFPSTRAQVSHHEQLSATLPKHYPAPSLLMLALSKQWKPRHVVLSAPVLTGASYLHVFKSPAAEERELERLEINERSVVFITDDNVGGRRGVVRVGGVDVGALRRELNSEENGMTIMMLQIMDANASQSWINAIKNAVLGQRYAYTWSLYRRQFSYRLVT